MIYFSNISLLLFILLDVSLSIFTMAEFENRSRTVDVLSQFLMRLVQEKDSSHVAEPHFRPPGCGSPTPLWRSNIL